MRKVGHNLLRLVKLAAAPQGIRGTDLRSGDLVMITTRNSVYMIRALGNAYYLVSGGWFDRKGLSPVRTTIAGCSWGGSLIKVDLVAARGMHLEFGNRVVTSTIEDVCVFRNGVLN